MQAGKEWHLPGVDFNDPNRPPTCLEVDFPILPINHVAAIEGNAGKPIYQMSKWWARRRSSVFRAMLIAAATKAPDDKGEAAKLVWDAYYGNHQKNGAFRKLRVADIFMGGGTTVVEGARLGMQMLGNDLNPVACFIVKNELAQVDPAEVQKFLDQIEAEVKPQLMPFYSCDCPRGHKGKWTQARTKQVMGSGFDPLSLTPAQRSDYEYTGPEITYTFWCKHGPCKNTQCRHRTPIMSSPIIAYKSLTVRAWQGKPCTTCGDAFDIEQHESRMAPSALLVVNPDEVPFAVMDVSGQYACPHCKQVHQDAKAKQEGQSARLGKSKNKKIDLTLLIHPDWLKGSPGEDDQGMPYGGSAQDDFESTVRWNAERQKTLKLIEVRGALPDEITVPDTGVVMKTGEGTVPRKSTFTCMESTCGLQSDVLEAIKKTHKTGAVAMHAIQGYCPECEKAGYPYAGRFFDRPTRSAYDAALAEWEKRRGEDLSGYWPTSELPFGFMTTMNNGGIPNHGFTHWWMMFNAIQLLTHSQLLHAILNAKGHSEPIRHLVLGGFQQYLQSQSMFCGWNIQTDRLSVVFAANNYYPKSVLIAGGSLWAQYFPIELENAGSIR